jgi:hypothetical protein
MLTEHADWLIFSNVQRFSTGHGDYAVGGTNWQAPLIKCALGALDLHAIPTNGRYTSVKRQTGQQNLQYAGVPAHRDDPSSCGR